MLMLGIPKHVDGSTHRGMEAAVRILALLWRLLKLWIILLSVLGGIYIGLNHPQKVVLNLEPVWYAREVTLYSVILGSIAFGVGLSCLFLGWDCIRLSYQNRTLRKRLNSLEPPRRAPKSESQNPSPRSRSTDTNSSSLAEVPTYAKLSSSPGDELGDDLNPHSSASSSSDHRARS